MDKDKKINWLIFTFSFFISLVGTEYLLRISGYHPGCFITDKELKGIPVDFNENDIRLVSFFKPDSIGILRIVPDSLNKLDIKKYSNLCSYQDFFQTKVNNDGFRGNEFEPDTIHKKNLLIGDSYTWGYSANPIDSCFADLLQSYMPDWKFYNAALPGVDVVSYKKNMDMLLPKLKPDIVVVNFYAGNDFIEYDKKLVPHAYNDLFLLNIGGLMNLNFDSCNKDSIEIFKTYMDALNYLRNKCFVNNTKLEQMVGHSSLATRLYSFFREDKMLYKNVHVVKFPKDNFATRRCFLDMRKICEQYNAKLIISVIPDEGDMSKGSFVRLEEKLKNELSPDIDYKLIKNLSKYDYAPEEYDTHFNNSGHLKYANFLRRILL